MTVVLMVSAVPEQGEEFVMIATDSLAINEQGAGRNEQAIKLFVAGNTLMSASKGDNEADTQDLVQLLEHNESKPLEYKINALKEKLAGRSTETIGLAQFDKEGNPQLAVVGSDTLEDGTTGPRTLNKDVAAVDFICFGETEDSRAQALIDELSGKLNAQSITMQSATNDAKWFIAEVAKLYPEKMNDQPQIDFIFS